MPDYIPEEADLLKVTEILSQKARQLYVEAFYLRLVAERNIASIRSISPQQSRISSPHPSSRSILPADLARKLSA